MLIRLHSISVKEMGMLMGVMLCLVSISATTQVWAAGLVSDVNAVIVVVMGTVLAVPQLRHFLTTQVARDVTIRKTVKIMNYA